VRVEFSKAEFSLKVVLTVRTGFGGDEEGFALMAMGKKRPEIGLLWKRQENCWRSRCR
jgi:hypothetical protein